MCPSLAIQVMNSVPDDYTKHESVSYIMLKTRSLRDTLLFSIESIFLKDG